MSIDFCLIYEKILLLWHEEYQKRKKTRKPIKDEE